MRKQLQSESDAILQKQIEEAIWRAIGFNRGDPEDKPGPLERKCAVAAVNAIQSGGHAIVPLRDLNLALAVLRFVYRTAGDEDAELERIINEFQTVIDNTNKAARPSDWMRT
jgi:hypothetical protein